MKNATAENRACANCNAENRFGWNNICVKFGIFVCGTCKSALQSFSFRVKVRQDADSA